MERAMSSSIRSSRRARADGERGFALLATLVLSVLFFALIALVLWESTLRYRAAQSFRARVVAQTLAENAAEVAARGLADGSSLSADAEIDDGTMKAAGQASRDVDGTVRFTIEAEGTTRGAHPARATVTVHGLLDGERVRVTRTRHSQ
jgi:Tfp pilus assembly protein PilV